MKVYSKSKKFKKLLEFFILKYQPVCYFCKQNIEPSLVRDNPITLTIHHINGNHEDNRIVNQSIAHRSCHKSYHAQLVLGEYARNKNGKINGGNA